MRAVVRVVLCFLIGLASVSCGQRSGRGPQASPRPAEELVFYDWADDVPQAVLDTFTAEYGIKVRYVTYGAEAEAVASIRAGKPYDVAVLSGYTLAQLATAGLLAEINYQNVPNARNIPANFRDLAYDPGGKHSVPYSWGTTGILYRTDLVTGPITQWADLWEMHGGGRIGMRDDFREGLAVPLKALGYPINSENPAHLEQAEARLMALRDAVVLVDSSAEGSAPLLRGEVVALVGWAEDVLYTREQQEAAPIAFVAPRDGILLWTDAFVIPASSPHRRTAELFLDFMLRPEIGAALAKGSGYAVANDAARPLLDAALRDDPVVYPPQEQIAAGEVYLPLSEEGARRYEEIWERFVAALP